MQDTKKLQSPNVANEPTAEYSRQYSYADYVKFDFDYMVELIKGKIYKMSAAPKSYHQEICFNLGRHIGNFLVSKPCKAYPAPFDVILPFNQKDKNKATSVVQPDLTVICDLDKIEEVGCVGAPDWVIEVISKRTAKKDMTDKYNLYEEAGVREYWVVYPLDYVVNVFVLEDGKYSRKPIFNQEDIASPTIFPEMKINLFDVFPKPKSG
ncbi:MAG: Uma2 family endonuclease [Halioglobus sp.]|jgi:Uma2 family endonuclease